MRSLRLLGLIILATASNLSVSEQQELCPVSLRYDFYEISGRSLSEAHELLKSKGPRDQLGHGRFAYSDWSIAWDWQRFGDGSVDPATIKLQCKATILLPKLVPQPEMPIAEIRAWNDFIERTNQHELRHIEHVERGAPRIVTQLKSAHKNRGRLLTKEANKIVKDEIAIIRALDDNYDRLTNHGEAEGTWRL